LKRLLALCFFVLGAFVPAGAQESASARNGSITGTVVKEPGSQPLKKVLVEIVAENQKEGGNYTASTDADGRFQVENVTPGRYRIFLEKTGFVGVNARGLKSDTNVFTVQSGQAEPGLLFRMSPTAIISGRITDEDGDPMSGVRVLALTRVPGKAKRETAGTGTTNDLGEYRLAGLFPGQYWLVAMPPPDFRDYEPQQEKSQPDNKPAGTQSDTRYLTTYYPGTYDAAGATSVTLKAGEEIPLHLTLVPARTYRVRGIVTGLGAGQKAEVELISKAGDSMHTGEVGTDGQFDIRGVGPGSYVLRASSGTEPQPLTAHQDISVVAADVEAVKLAPLASFRLSGHLSMEGGAAGDLAQYAVNLHRADAPEDPGFFMSPDFFGTTAPVDRLGNFEWKDVTPGAYVVKLYGGDGRSSLFLKSATLGGRDIETGFTASGPATLDLVASSKGGIVDGTVVFHDDDRQKDADTDPRNTGPGNADPRNNDHLVADATVVAVPEQKYRKLFDHFGIGSTDQYGHFTIRGLAPGSYTVYAWQDLGDGIWYDAEFLKSQEANGTALKVEEGSHPMIELKLSPAGEEWR
jgi:protocatechuate 3,4-dioxygenase beta subunit